MKRVPNDPCGHLYITSAGRCLHCHLDVSTELAAATNALIANIDLILSGRAPQ